MRRLLLILFVAPMLMLAQLPSVPATPTNVILDTDVGNDVGDADAIWVTLRLAQRGHFRLLAGIGTSPITANGPVLETFLLYAGFGTIPMGVYKGSAITPVSDDYGTSLTNDINNTPRRSADTYEDAVLTYRRALAGAANASVTVMIVGFGSNFSALLQSGSNYGGDGLGTGMSLVTAKVSQLVWAGGFFPAFQHIGILSLEFHVDKLSRPLL